MQPWTAGPNFLLLSAEQKARLATGLSYSGLTRHLGLRWKHRVPDHLISHAVLWGMSMAVYPPGPASAGIEMQANGSLPVIPLYLPVPPMMMWARDRRASSTSRFQSTRNAPPKRGISVVMGCVSRPLNLSSVKEQTVSPWSRRALEVDICQSEPCRPDTCQPEQAPEAVAPCEAGRQQRQRSASPRMQPVQLESSA